MVLSHIIEILEKVHSEILEAIVRTHREQFGILAINLLLVVYREYVIGFLGISFWRRGGGTCHYGYPGKM